MFVEESIDEGTQWAVFEPNHSEDLSVASRGGYRPASRRWRLSAGGLRSRLRPATAKNRTRPFRTPIRRVLRRLATEEAPPEGARRE